MKRKKIKPCLRCDKPVKMPYRLCCMCRKYIEAFNIDGGLDNMDKRDWG